MNRERALALLLRYLGVVMLAAAGAVVMPFEWMDSIHRRLGMGELPPLPIVQYLTRSASALYVGYGALLLYLAREPRRYREAIGFVALLGSVFGFVILGVDLAAKLPWFWTAFEGPWVILFCGLLSWLARSLPSRPASPDGGDR